MGVVAYLLVMSMGCSKMVEPIEMPCRMWTCTRHHILGGSPDHHIVRATFRGHSCMQAVFSTLFTQGQQQCGLWLPVCYRNLLSYTVSELWLLFLFWTGPKLFVKPTQKSNRSIITNAVSHCCLAGHVNKDKVDKALEVHQVITVDSRSCCYTQRCSSYCIAESKIYLCCSPHHSCYFASCGLWK